MRLLALIAAAASMAFATPSLAQEGEAARRLELAERYVTVSMGENVENMVADLIERELASAGALPPEERAWLRANMPPLLMTAIERLAKDLAPIYAEIYTLAELEALNDFFSTPLGQSIARKQFEAAVREEEALNVALGGFFEEFVSKYCQEFDCDGVAASEGKIKQ